MYRAETQGGLPVECRATGKKLDGQSVAQRIEIPGAVPETVLQPGGASGAVSALVSVPGGASGAVSALVSVPVSASASAHATVLATSPGRASGEGSGAAPGGASASALTVAVSVRRVVFFSTVAALAAIFAAAIGAEPGAVLALLRQTSGRVAPGQKTSTPRLSPAMLGLLPFCRLYGAFRQAKKQHPPPQKMRR